MRPQRMTYDMADHRNDHDSAHWGGILSKTSNPSKYGALLVREQRNIVTVKRIDNTPDYPTEYALLWFMEHGFVPDRTPEGHAVDQKAAKKHIQLFNKRPSVILMVGETSRKLT